MRNLLLGALYYIVVTPLGFALRLTHDPLARRWRGRKDSYWMEPILSRRPSAAGNPNHATATA